MEVKQPEVIENAPPSEPDWRIVDDYYPSEKKEAVKEKHGLLKRLVDLFRL